MYKILHCTTHYTYRQRTPNFKLTDTFIQNTESWSSSCLAYDCNTCNLVYPNGSFKYYTMMPSWKDGVTMCLVCYMSVVMGWIYGYIKQENIIFIFWNGKFLVT